MSFVSFRPSRLGGVCQLLVSGLVGLVGLAGVSAGAQTVP